jgi:hypothetical protein
LMGVASVQTTKSSSPASTQSIELFAAQRTPPAPNITERVDQVNRRPTTQQPARRLALAKEADDHSSNKQRAACGLGSDDRQHVMGELQTYLIALNTLALGCTRRARETPGGILDIQLFGRAADSVNTLQIEPSGQHQQKNYVITANTVLEMHMTSSTGRIAYVRPQMSISQDTSNFLLAKETRDSPKKVTHQQLKVQKWTTHSPRPSKSSLVIVNCLINCAVIKAISINIILRPWILLQETRSLDHLCSRGMATNRRCVSQSMLSNSSRDRRPEEGTRDIEKVRRIDVRYSKETPLPDRLLTASVHLPPLLSSYPEAAQIGCGMIHSVRHSSKGQLPPQKPVTQQSTDRVRRPHGGECYVQIALALMRARLTRTYKYFICVTYVTLNLLALN